MEPTAITTLVQTLGMPIAALIAIGWFITFRLWPYYTGWMDAREKADQEHRAAISKALQNSSEILVNLVQTTVQLRTTLETMNQSLHDLHTDMMALRQDVSALYERNGETRPSRKQREGISS